MEAKEANNLKEFDIDDNNKLSEFLLRLCINIGIDSNGKDVVFGPGVDCLMHEVKNNGSILMATQKMGMSYSKSWKIIRNVESCLGFQIIERHTGRGNGSSLTPKGEEFLACYDAFVEEVNQAAKESFIKHFSEFQKE